MTDDLMSEQSVEVRVGHHNHLTVGRSQNRRLSELASFAGQFERKRVECWIRQQFVAPPFGECLKSALLANGIVDFLMAAACLGYDVTVALGKGEGLRNQCAGRIDEEFVAQFSSR